MAVLTDPLKQALDAFCEAGASTTTTSHSEPPLTAEPFLAEDAPLTSEPPLTAESPLVSEPPVAGDCPDPMEI